MQDKKNDIVIINLDRPRQLWCGHKALKRFAAMAGKDALNIDTSQFGPAEVELIMYCMMLTDAEDHGNDLKLEDMENLLDKVKYSEVLSKMNEAMEAAFGSDDEKNA